jgi:hypothetical protein
MELGKVETAQLAFSFEQFRNIVAVGLPNVDYWAYFKEIEVPHEISQRYRGFSFHDVLARAIWYDNYSAKVYSKNTPSIVLGEISMPSVRAALITMSQEYNEYFEYLMKPNVEDVDCDVFLQLATMGELRFG